MSVTTTAGQPTMGSNIRMAETVRDAIERLDPETAAAVDQAIQSIGQIRGEPIGIEIPGSPRGRKYLAMVPADEAAPVVIYRRDGAGWLVAALISPDAYERQKQAEHRSAAAAAGVVTGAAIGAAIALGSIINRGGSS